jgi:opacity protein-like surface antigen
MKSMKKIYFIITFLIIVMCCKVFADVVVTSRKSGQTQTSTQKQQTQTTQKSTSSNLSNNVKSCTPYSEKLNTSVSGINFTFNVKIIGWVNNKCRLDFNAQSNGINEMFSSIYGFDASEATISTFEPKVRCDFTKQQLNYVGDSILQEQERNAGAKNNMLKNPQNINLSVNSASDAALLDVVLNQGACNILNSDDSTKMFQNLFNF